VDPRIRVGHEKTRVIWYGKDEAVPYGD
jgi:hypothetical protein